MEASITVAAVVCVAICMSGDIAQDLKTGALMGATPSKQQLGEILGTLSFALIGGSVVVLLNEAYTLGSAELPTPQGRLMADLVQGVMGGRLPWTLLGVGAGIALCVELLGVASLPFAIGLYLPVTTSAPVIFGGLLAWFVSRHRLGGRARERGILFGSGLIAGDALLGVLLAFLSVTPLGVHADGSRRFLADFIVLREPGPGGVEDLVALLPFLALVTVFWMTIRGRRDGNA
jgi:putative OPT family oligopeptide transporter